MGLGHAFNKDGDLMCSIEGGKDTCSYYNKVRTPTDFNLVAVAKLYGKDGYKVPNYEPVYSEKFTAEDYNNFYLNMAQSESNTNTNPITKQFPETNYQVPEWVKNNAKWWSAGSINDGDFATGIEFLILEEIVEIKTSSIGTSSVSIDNIPNWIKTNAGWWADGSIDEKSFIQGIEYLIEQGIITVN
jgi:hypothetical protein